MQVPAVPDPPVVLSVRSDDDVTGGEALLPHPSSACGRLRPQMSEVLVLLPGCGHLVDDLCGGDSTVDVQLFQQAVDLLRSVAAVSKIVLAFN
jgi:hypothetical protein